MHDNLDDSVHDLMSSEQLNAFSIVEKFCNECARMTPHHVDESEFKAKELTIDSEESEVVLENINSDYECIYCREKEEAFEEY